MKKLIIKIFILSVTFICSYFILKLLLNNEQKLLIKKYIFPYKLISQQEKTISQQQNMISNQRDRASALHNIFANINFSLLELDVKEKNSDILTKKTTVKLSNNLILNKYQFTSGFYAGINNIFPGSGYIDFHKNNILVLSSRGILTYKKDLNNDQISFKQIRNNINDFINLKQFNKGKEFSLKDLLIYNNKIYISYTEEIKKDCWNTSIIYGNINYENIIFKKLFSPKECIHSINNIDREFMAVQSGGRIIALDNNHILLSIGDYRNRYLAQDKNSVNGKIIKINIINMNYEIISMGHRNPQGLYLDKKNNLILETEHGPFGGDEINIIQLNKITKIKIQNYGWPVSSAGEHYDGKVEKNRKKYEKYPLHKSHSKYGFIEPLYSFVPSIGISEIAKIGQNKYVVGSMRGQSIYFFKINKKKQITNLNRVEISERIRDLKFNNNKLYLFMEKSAAIGLINIK